MVTETGAEANRDGPEEEKGTYEFQSEFANFHFGVYATKPWLSGAIWWGLQEFRVRPTWDGGNPRPSSPIHTKGLITRTASRSPRSSSCSASTMRRSKSGAAETRYHPAPQWPRVSPHL